MGQKYNSQAVMAIHGGAGVITRAEMSPQIERDYRDILKAVPASLKRPDQLRGLFRLVSRGPADTIYPTPLPVE